MNTCTGCNTDFSSVSSFDAHQRQDGAVVTCLDPEDVGLVYDADRDLFKHPAPSEPITYSVSTEPRAPKVYKCPSCNGNFVGTGQRGRPPVKCSRPACGGKGIPVG